MKRNLLLALAGVFLAFQVYAQRTITGTVTSAEDGSTLPGVSVVVKGTVVGTTTDLSGNYEIDVPAGGSVLVFSFVGMKTQEVAIGSSNTINVTMEVDALGIDEVVVTAIGIEREAKALGYAAQEVSGKEIEDSRRTSVIDALNGKVAGVRINRASGEAGASSFIEIRGSASITRSNQPLFVVDGVPIDNSGNSGNNVAGVTESNRAIDLNPEDIASITVLKGGAATALYGLRAANGAIIITTKRGAKNQGMQVNFSTSYTSSKVSNLPPLQEKFGQGSFAYTDLLRSFGLPANYVFEPDQGFYKAVSWGPPISEEVWVNDPSYVPANFFWGGGSTSMDVWTKYWDPHGRILWTGDTMVQNDPVLSGLAANGTPVTPYDRFSFFQKGMSWRNHLSISGGDDKSTFYLSFGTDNSEGIVPNNRFDRTSVKFAADRDVSNALSVGANVQYINSKGVRIQKGSNISGLMLGLLRTPVTFDNSYGYQLPDGSQRNFRGGPGYDNPYWVVNKIRYTDRVNRIIGDLHASWDVNSWLNVFYRFGIDNWFKDVRNYFEKNSNEWPDGYNGVSNSWNSDINSDLIISINKDLSDDLSLHAKLGQNMYQSTYEATSAQAYGLQLFDFYNMTNTADNRGTESNFRKRTAAVYAEAALDYKRMLYLDLTGRYEWSTTLPEANNAFFYPSASLSFVFTELPALQDNDILSFGKLRVSYANIANDAAAYATRTYYFQPGPRDGWTNGLTFPFLGVNSYTLGDVIGNQNLRPENMKTFEVGADLRFFNGRVNLDVAYFKNNSTDLLLSVPVAPSSGFQANYVNAGAMTTHGFEVVLNANVVNTSGFTWDITANWSNPYSEVTQLAEGVEDVFLSGFTEPQVRAVVGLPYRTLFGLRWTRDANDNIVIDDDPNNSIMDGFPFSDPSMQPMGRVDPDWTAGIINTFSYKGFSLSALLDIKKGGLMWNGTKGALYFFGTHKDTETRGEKKVWQGVYGHIDPATGELVHYATPFDDASAVENGAGATNSTEVTVDEYWYWWDGEGSGFTGPSEPYVEHTDWIRLRELTLAYTFNNDMLQKTPFSSLEVYFTGINLWLSTPYTGVDPETSLVGNNNGLGIDYFNNPGTKDYTFGLRLGL